jgi:hypothetical protein
MPKRSIDTLQETTAAARSAAEHSGGEPRHAEPSAADAWRDHLIEPRLKCEPGRECMWDARMSLRGR